MKLSDKNRERLERLALTHLLVKATCQAIRCGQEPEDCLVSCIEGLAAVADELECSQGVR